MLENTRRAAFKHPRSAEFLETLLPFLSNNQARKEVAFLVRNTFSRYLTWRDGLLRGALVIGFTTGRSNALATTRTRRAYVFLHLRTGPVYGIEVEGVIDAALTRIEWLAEQLACQEMSEANLDAVETILNKGVARCMLRLLRHAPLYPTASFCAALNRDAGAQVVLGACAPASGAPASHVKTLITRHFSQVLGADNAAFTAFYEALDREALRVIGMMNKSSGVEAAQLAVYNFLGGASALQQRNRMQAVLELPWLATILGRLEGAAWEATRLSEARQRPSRWDNVREGIIQAIDDGVPLFSFLSGLLGIPRETIAWSRGQTLSHPLLIYRGVPERWLQLLSRMPAKLRPHCADDWQQLCAWADACLALLASLLRRPLLDLLPEVDRMPPGAAWLDAEIEKILVRWLTSMARCHQAQDPVTYRANLHALERSHAFGAALADVLAHERGCADQQGAMCDHGRSGKQMLQWLYGANLEQVLSLVRQWQSLLAYAPPAERDGHWEPLMERVFCWKEFTVTELTSTLALHQEGRDMQHCAGKYSAACQQGESIIFSVRHSSQSDRSTLELGWDGKTLLFRQKNHRSKYNKEPSAKCMEAAQNFTCHLNSLAHPARAEIAARLLSRRQSGASDAIGTRPSLSIPVNPDAEFKRNAAWQVFSADRQGVNSISRTSL